MKLFNGKLDLSRINPLELTNEGGIERHSAALLEEAVRMFAETAYDAHSAPARENVWACAEDYLACAPAAEVRAIRRYLKHKLRELSRAASAEKLREN